MCKNEIKLISDVINSLKRISIELDNESHKNELENKAYQLENLILADHLGFRIDENFNPICVEHIDEEAFE